MELYINTIKDDSKKIELRLEEGKKVIARSVVEAERKQAEKLLPGIAALLKRARKTPGDITKIRVENKGGSFTSLRIGVAAANGLGYGLKVPVSGAAGPGRRAKIFSIVRPDYSHKPKITVKKKNLARGLWISC